MSCTEDTLVQQSVDSKGYIMRTTLNIDDELLGEVRRLAKLGGTELQLKKALRRTPS